MQLGYNKTLPENMIQIYGTTNAQQLNFCHWIYIYIYIHSWCQSVFDGWVNLPFATHSSGQHTKHSVLSRPNA